MKILKFCIPLFGLFLLVNAPLKAQHLPDDLILPTPNVSMESISVNNSAFTNGGVHLQMEEIGV